MTSTSNVPFMNIVFCRTVVQEEEISVRATSVMVVPK